MAEPGRMNGETQNRSTETFNIHKDKRNRCEHAGKYQTLTAGRSLVRLRGPQSVDYN